MTRTRSIIALILLGAAVYGHSLRFGFVYDDHDEVESNPFIRSIEHAPAYFSKPFWSVTADGSFKSNIYRPLKLLSYFVDYRIGGTSPAVYHLSNVVFHLAAALLFFLLMVRSGFPDAVSFFGAAFFLLHPMNSETAYYISGRPDPLAAVFFLCAWLGIRSENKKTVLLSAFSFFAAVLCKETALILFPVLLWRSAKAPHRRIAWAGAAAALLLTSLLKSAAGIETPFSLLLRPMATVPYWLALLKYAEFLVFPFSPAGYRELPWAAVHPRTYVALLLLATVIFAAYRNSARRTLWIAALILLLLPLHLAASLSVASGLLSDRYLYFSVLGLALLSGMIAENAGPARVVASVFAPVLIFFSLFSFAAGWQWENDGAFWAFANKINPRSPVPYRNMGVLLIEGGRIDDAEENFHIALSASRHNLFYEETYLQTVQSLGALYYQRKDFNRSLKYFSHLAKRRPDRPEYAGLAAKVLGRAQGTGDGDGVGVTKRIP